MVQFIILIIDPLEFSLVWQKAEASNRFFLPCVIINTSAFYLFAFLYIHRIII